ncbi:unnamed protein product [Camellia sinensis]
MAKMRSLNRSICFKSLCSSSAAVNHRQHLQQGLCYFHLSPPPPPFPFSSKTIPSGRCTARSASHLSVSLLPPSTTVNTSHKASAISISPLLLPPFNFLPKPSLPDCRPPFTMAIGSTRFFSEDVTHFPDIKDPEILFVFKDLMAASWDELPDTLISDANKALSKNTDDKAAQEAVANVFRAAEAVGEFSGMLVSLRMAIDDSTGMGGEDVKPLPEEFVNALRTVYQRYTAYLDAFGPEETYLRKKVETELGTKMIHLKMRCSGIGSEWGKGTLLQFWGLLDFQVPMLSTELSFLEMVKSIMSSCCLFSWGTLFIL